MLDLMTRSLSHFLSSLRMQLGLAVEVGWPDPRRDADEDWPEGMWEELRIARARRSFMLGTSQIGEALPTISAFSVIRGLEELKAELRGDS
jgi:hypothetical protein